MKSGEGETRIHQLRAKVVMSIRRVGGKNFGLPSHLSANRSTSSGGRQPRDVGIWRVCVDGGNVPFSM
ncbi:MAG TPA: hypothetical protein DGH68_03370 [Bacteroidetes bacterium]|nr:hypothetical protein [Bacteroidota bacterium]